MAGELDEDAEDFRAKWQARLGLSDREALSSYMRSVAADMAGQSNLDTSDTGQTYFCIRVDGRGIDAAVNPGAIPYMIAEWQGRIDAEEPTDPRKFSKRSIIEAVGRNIHLDDEIGPLVVCAAVWIAAQDRRVAVPLHQGGVTLFVTFTFDDERRTRRMQIELGFKPEDIA